MIFVLQRQSGMVADHFIKMLTNGWAFSPNECSVDTVTRECIGFQKVIRRSIS